MRRSPRSGADEAEPRRGWWTGVLVRVLTPELGDSRRRAPTAARRAWTADAGLAAGGRTAGGSIAAHVSGAIPAIDPRVWRVVGTPLVEATGSGALDGETIAVKDLFEIAGQQVGGGVPGLPRRGRARRRRPRLPLARCSRRELRSPGSPGPTSSPTASPGSTRTTGPRRTSPCPGPFPEARRADPPPPSPSARRRSVSPRTPLDRSACLPRTRGSGVCGPRHGAVPVGRAAAARAVLRHGRLARPETFPRFDGSPASDCPRTAPPFRRRSPSRLHCSPLSMSRSARRSGPASASWSATGASPCRSRCR